MSDNDVTLTIWLIGSAEPMKFDMPHAKAEEKQETIERRLATEHPVGCMRIDETIVRHAAIAAVRIVTPTAPWAFRG